MSNRDKLIWTIIGLVIVLGGIYLIWRGNNSGDQGNAKELADLIQVDTPEPGDRLSSPVEIEGEARGNWFFEGSFPATLVDGEGNELATVVVQSDGEWMTEDFVPFTAMVEFDAPTTATGTLLLMKDNPSGDPELDQTLRIPVRFELDEEAMTLDDEAMMEDDKTDIPTDSMTKPNSTILSPSQPTTSMSSSMPVLAYFGTCEEVQPVTRQVPRTVAVARAALTELLKGPTAAEQAAGYETSIPAGVSILDLRIAEGLAMVNFSAQLDEDVAGSCRVGGIRAQIESTLKQFPTVSQVLILVDGQFEGVLQP